MLIVWCLPFNCSFPLMVRYQESISPLKHLVLYTGARSTTTLYLLSLFLCRGPQFHCKNPWSQFQGQLSTLCQSIAQHLGKFAKIPQISFQFGKLVPAHMDFLGFKKFSNILTVSHSMTSQIYNELELSWYVNSIYVYKNNLQIVSFSCIFHTTRCLLLQVSVKETTICLMLFCCVFFCEAF